MADNSKAAIAAKGKLGKPFQKGDDPRRHMGGTKSKAAIEFSKTIKELLIKEGKRKQIGTIGDKESTRIVKLKKVEWLIKAVWQKAIIGESWAVNFIAERIEGKVTQSIDMKGKFEILSITDMKKSLKEFENDGSE